MKPWNIEVKRIKNSLTLRQALLAVWIPTVMLFAITASVFYGWQFLKKLLQDNPHYTIEALVLKNSSHDSLTPSMMAELLLLSCDRPSNVWSYPIENAETRLKAHPLFTTITIKTIRPRSLQIDYAMRSPKAILGERVNTAIDQSGVLFPIRPFYTPKKLPTIYLGEDLPQDYSLYGKELTSPKAKCALELLDQFSKVENANYRLISLDVSRSDLENSGKKEVVALFEGKNLKTRQLLYVRLSPKSLTSGISRLERLINSSDFKGSQTTDIVIDLRLDKVAFMKPTQYRITI